MPVSWSRAHRARLAELVAARAERSPADTVRIARWLTDAGEAVPADMLLEAAKAANLAGTETGLEFAQRAIEAVQGRRRTWCSQPPIRFTADRLGRGDPRRSRGRHRGPDARAGYLRQRAAGLQWGLGRAQHAVELLDRANTWWPEETWRRQVEVLRLPFVALTDAPGTHPCAGTGAEGRLVERASEALAGARPRCRPLLGGGGT